MSSAFVQASSAVTDSGIPEYVKFHGEYRGLLLHDIYASL